MISVNTKNEKKEKKRGRPPGKAHAIPFQMRVSDQFIAVVDEWRRKQPDIPSRTEAVRRMVAAVAGRK